MLSIWSVSVISLFYLAFLFALAWFVEKYRVNKYKSLIYSLTLSIYCTSWAFYGTTAQAANNGWWLAPTYAGSILLFVFGWRVYIRIADICRQQKLTSLADFIATRYGQSSQLSGLVSLISVIAIVPYISLQLSAISQSIGLISGGDQVELFWQDSTFYITLVLALFAILFGANRVRPSENNPGLMTSIAFESIVKLLAFLMVGIYVCFFVFDSPQALFEQARQAQIPQTILDNKSASYVYFGHMVLGLLAMLCLPRQFHVSFIEVTSNKDLFHARWIFPTYLVLISLFLLPIAYAGRLLFDGENVAYDSFVLAIPLSQGNDGMTLISYLGGFSAAISMVIVSAIVLSVMITNDFINQFVLRRAQLSSMSSGLTTLHLLRARRAVILLVLIASYFCHRMLSGANTLANVGLLSFTLVAQFAPALLIGLWWRGASRLGAQLGIATGFVVWLYTLLLPAIAAGIGYQAEWLVNGPWQVSWLAPTDFWSLSLDATTQTLLLSLTLNTFVFVMVSSLYGAGLSEKLQSNKFILVNESDKPTTAKRAFTYAELASLLQRFVDKASGQELVLTHFPTQQGDWKKAAPLAIFNLVEREMAAVIGGASARLILDAARNQQTDSLNQVADFVDEASQVLKFNRDLLQSTIENINQGISVVDQELNLVAWNSGYKEMFNYPEGALYIGRPIADIIRFNAQRGLFKTQDIEQEIEKRLAYLKLGSAYKYQRAHQDGRVFEMQGNPLPGGGFVTTFTDVTEYIQTQQALTDANTNLEQKVTQRTQALTEANTQLVLAKQTAELATESKTRFFAAASHDLLQPFNAASLFCAVMEEKSQDTELRELAQHIKSSLNSAEDLLSNILELTKLESGAMRLDKQTFSLSRLLEPLQVEFSALAHNKQLALEFNYREARIISDRTLLRRVLQNLLSNAIRYTDSGRVSVSCEASDTLLTISVHDTGPGIAMADQHIIFEEFKQLNSANKAQGLGLGLAITKRICDTLDISLNLTSDIGQGACFSVSIPLSTEQLARTNETAPVELVTGFDGLTIWLVDNDMQVLSALQTLLENWGCCVYTAHDIDSVQQLTNAMVRPQLIIVDYQLDDGVTGIDLITACDLIGIPCIVNTANRDEEIREKIQEAGLPLLYKPVKAPALRRLIKKLCYEE